MVGLIRVVQAGPNPLFQVYIVILPSSSKIQKSNMVICLQVLVSLIDYFLALGTFYFQEDAKQTTSAMNYPDQSNLSVRCNYKR